MRASIFFLCGLVAIAATTSAHAYPMSGIDTIYYADQGAVVSLADKKRQDLTLENGHAYRLRLSTQSSSLHVMAGGDADNELKVDGNFPRKDLRNFDLAGDKIGNPGMTLVGRTVEISNGSRVEQRSDSCSWICDRRNECRQIRDEVCRKDRDGHKVCTPITREECHSVPVSCFGTTHYEVDVTDYETDFDMAVIDAASNNRLGNFHGIVSRRSSDGYRRLINSSCPY